MFSKDENVQIILKNAAEKAIKQQLWLSKHRKPNLKPHWLVREEGDTSNCVYNR